MKKCQNCGNTQFRREVTIKLSAVAIIDGDGSFCDFSGDLNDLAKESDIIEREETLTCADCETEYDADEDDGTEWDTDGDSMHDDG